MSEEKGWKTGAYVPHGCITVLVDKDGSLAGAQMPDGTEIPQVTGISVSGEVGSCQTATITLYAKVRQFEER